jgi:hypothetical protein
MKDKVHYDWLFNRKPFCGCSTKRYGDLTTIKNKVTCKNCRKLLILDGYRKPFK